MGRGRGAVVRLSIFYLYFLFNSSALSDSLGSQRQKEAYSK